MISHTAFFGDGEYTFAFPSRDLIEELERQTGKPVGALFWRLRNHDFAFADILQVIRLGLIGGGSTPANADQLVSVYVIGRPLAESFAVALGTMSALFFGAEDKGQDEPQAAATSGDLAAAINEALQEAGV